MINLIKKESDLILGYIVVFIICVLFAVSYLQFLLFTADILLTVQQINKSDISVLKWLLCTFDVLKIFVILELVLWVKYKKRGSVSIFVVGSGMFFIWLYHATTHYYSYMDDMISFLQGWILSNGIILSLFASVSQVVLFILYGIRKNK